MMQRGALEARIRRVERGLSAFGPSLLAARRELQAIEAGIQSIGIPYPPFPETVDTDCCTGVPTTLNLVLTTPAESWMLTYTPSMNVTWYTDFDWEGLPGWLFDNGSVAIAFWCDGFYWQFEYYRAPLNNGTIGWTTYSCPLTSLVIDIPDRGAGRFVGTISVS